MKQIVNMQRIIGNINYIFDCANKDLFGNSLEKPIFTCSPTKGAYGHMSVVNFWCTREGQGLRELNINSEYLDRPLENIVGTIIHEMVHCYCKQYNIKDCSGAYHNKRFKEEAEKRTLSMEQHHNYGWAITHITDDTIDFILRNDIRDFDITRDIKFNPVIGVSNNGNSSFNTGIENGIKRTKKPSSTRKYQCLKCKNSVRATKAINIICGDCMEKMVIV